MKTIGIEALLRWAYCEELPKAEAIGDAIGRCAPREPGNHWKGTASVGALLTVVDARYNRFGVVADPTALSPPHNDAVAVGALVAELAALELDVPEDWCPLADFVLAGAMTEDEAAAATVRGLARVLRIDAEGRRTVGERAARLVIRHAVLGGAPDREAEAPERKVVSAHGKPKWFRMMQVWSGAVDADGNAVAGLGAWVDVEVDGFNPRRRIPYPDAYQKQFFDPDPADAVVLRADYALWHAALGFLVAELGRAGLACTVGDSARPAMPWCDNGGADGKVPRVLMARPWAGEVAFSGLSAVRALGMKRALRSTVRHLPLTGATVA